jgi:hypothetical protein
MYIISASVLCILHLLSLSLSLTHPFYVDSNSSCVCCRHKSVCGELVSVCGVLVQVYTHADAYVLYMSLMCAQYHDIHWCSCEHDYRVFIV